MSDETHPAGTAPGAGEPASGARRDSAADFARMTKVEARIAAET